LSELQISKEFTLLPADNQRLANFCGQFDAHLRQIEQRLKVEVANRGNQFKVTGLADAVKAASAVIQTLFEATIEEVITPEDIHLAM
jgi:phosphate starvation-inducible PhoH-like protein